MKKCNNYYLERFLNQSHFCVGISRPVDFAPFAPKQVTLYSELPFVTIWSGFPVNTLRTMAVAVTNKISCFGPPNATPETPVTPMSITFTILFFLFSKATKRSLNLFVLIPYTSYGLPWIYNVDGVAIVRHINIAIRICF